MYCLTDEQVAYILNDIRRRGVEMEDLQLNLLDHICCIVEQELKEGDDFEHFYQQIIPRFYRKALREIEDETINLLKFKNYYGMKKLMIFSGVFSATAFITGSFFKIMRWPTAGLQLVSAIIVLSLVFLPLLFLLKVKETGNQGNRWILAIATAVGILFCLSTLFLIHHWPGSRLIWLITLSVSFFVLVPLYFFSGIRKPETRTNTIVTTILMLGFLGVEFTMTSLRTSPQTIGRVYAYLQSETMLDKAQQQALPASKAALDIQNTCERMKNYILKQDMGLTYIPEDFEQTGLTIREKNANNLFDIDEGKTLMAKLRAEVDIYNATQTDTPGSRIPIAYSILEPGFIKKNFCSNLFVLNNIVQLQLFIANAENNKIAAK